MLTDKQLAMRRNGIGSSEVAGILGLSPFTDPVKIWIDKCAPHLSTRPENKPFGLLDMGNLMEPVVAKAYCIEHRLTAKKYLDTIQHPVVSWMMCTPDYKLSNGRGLECKNVHSAAAYEWGSSGSDRIPIHYIPQVQQCMAVLHQDDWAAAAIIGGTDFRHYLIKRDDELIAMMVEECEKFWHDYVAPKKIPPANLGPSTACEYLKKIYPEQKNKETVEINEDHPVYENLKRIKELRQASKLIKEEMSLMTAAVQAAIQDGYRFKYGSGKGSMAASWGVGGEKVYIDWEELAGELMENLEVDRAKVIEKHTKKIQKARKFTVTIKGDETEEESE
jgi:putative phage-type endonuclease